MDLNILSLSLSSYIRNYTLRGFLFEVDSWKIHQGSSISQHAQKTGASHIFLFKAQVYYHPLLFIAAGRETKGER